MTITANIFKIFLVIIIFIAGCNTRLHRSDTRTDKRTRAEKRFDPLGFIGDDKVITGKGRKTEKLVRMDTAIIPDAQTDSVTNTDDSTWVDFEEEPVVVFRVQVFASKSFDEAQEFAAEIEPLFPEGVFVEYQMPYYKVRVGEYYDPDEGESVLEEVKQMGFRNAWLVRIIK